MQMKNSMHAVKSASAVATLILLGGGRWFNLRVVNGIPFDESLMKGFFFGTVLAMMVPFLIDLMFARGYLQFKIRSLQVLFVVLFFGAVLEKRILDLMHIQWMSFFVVSLTGAAENPQCPVICVTTP